MGYDNRLIILSGHLRANLPNTLTCVKADGIIPTLNFVSRISVAETSNKIGLLFPFNKQERGFLAVRFFID